MNATLSAEGLKADLLLRPGRWYAVRARNGGENVAKANLLQRVQNLGLECEIFEVEVPVKQVVSIRGGRRKSASVPILPGYLLIRMHLTDATQAAVRDTPSIMGFVGVAAQPMPLSIDDVVKFLMPPEPQTPIADGNDVVPSLHENRFDSGDVVSILEGPFAGASATVSEVGGGGNKLTVLVSLFGRDTPVEIHAHQVSKII